VVVVAATTAGSAAAGRVRAVVALVFLCAASAAPAVAGGERGPVVGAVLVSVDPGHLVAGESAEASITVEVVSAEGSAIDVGAPLLLASTGIVGRPTRTGPGRFVARFSPPPEAFPHVALVAAVVEHGGATAVGFVGLQLWGRGKTSVKTRPGAHVTVQVGADAFGPIVAGADGNALVPILVPPGPDRGIATSVDALGNESRKTIDLAVPPFDRVALYVLDDVCVAGGAARVLLLAIDKHGAPLVGARFIVTVDDAPTSTKPTPLAPGVYLWSWAPPAGRSRTARIGVALADAPASRAGGDVRVLSAPPQRATIELSTTRLSADDDGVVGARVVLVDATGAPLPPTAARVDVDVGYIDVVTTSGVDRTLAWVVPRKTAASAGTLTVRAPTGAVLGAATVALSQGRVARLAFLPVAGVTADGRATVDVELAAFDAAGNEVSPADVLVTTPAGRLLDARVDTDARRWRARFAPDAVGAPGVAVLEARLGSLTARLAVDVRPAPRAALRLAPMLASSVGTGGVASVGPEVSVLARLPVLDGAVYAGATGGVLFGVGAATTDYASLRMVPLLAEAAWRPRLPLDVGVDAGVHVGAAAGVVVVDVIVDGERVVVPAGVGAAVLGGYVDVGPGSVELALRLGLGVPLGGRLPGFAAPPFGPGLVVGYRFGF
jgi:hypothetical protein